MKISNITGWLIAHSIKTLNVAGPRESEWPGAWSKSRKLVEQLLKLIH
ncbi:MAG: YpsA SLOG family protein [Tangfeifania sp.]